MRDTLDEEFSFSFDALLVAHRFLKPNSQVQILSVNPIILCQNKVKQIKVL